MSTGYGEALDALATPPLSHSLPSIPQLQILKAKSMGMGGFMSHNTPFQTAADLHDVIRLCH